MLMRFLTALCVVVLMATSAAADPVAPARATAAERARAEPLMQAMAMDELVEILRLEGLAHGAKLREEMFPGRGLGRWPDIVAGIYDTERMSLIMLDEIAAGMEPWHLDPLLDFFRSDLGRRIVSLEISARRAMLEPSVEAAGREYVARLEAGDGARLALLEEFADVNDLVESNVTAGLNATFAFYTGLNAAGGFGDYRGEGDMLDDVWRREPEIRRETGEWLMSYIALSYQPLTDAELARYVDFSRSEAGRNLNHDLFAAFDELFQTISNEMGRAAAQFLGGEDL